MNDVVGEIEDVEEIPDSHAADPDADTATDRGSAQLPVPQEMVQEIVSDDRRPSKRKPRSRMPGPRRRR